MKGHHVGCNPLIFSFELNYSSLNQLNLVFKDIDDLVIEIVVRIISFPDFFKPLALWSWMGKLNIVAACSSLNEYYFCGLDGLEGLFFADAPFGFGVI